MIVKTRTNGTSMIVTIPKPIIDLLDIKNGEQLIVFASATDMTITYKLATQEEINEHVKRSLHE